MEDGKKIKITKHLKAATEQLIQEYGISTLRREDVEILVEDLRIREIEFEAQTKKLKNTQEQLQRALNNFRDLYDKAPGALVSIDRNFTIQEANAAVAQLFGVPRSRLLNQKFIEFIVPTTESQDTFCLFARKTFQKEIDQVCELEMQRKDGSRFSGHLKGVLANDFSNQEKQLHIAVNDITQQKKSAELLRLSEANLRRAEVIASLGHFYISLKTGKIWGSQSAKLIYGYDTNEADLSDIRKLTLPENREMLDKAMENLISDGKPYNVEFKIKRLSDSKIIDINSLAEIDVEKQVIFGIVQDITERKRTEEALKESEEKYHSLFDNLNSAALLIEPILDKDGRLVDLLFLIANPVVEKHLGKTPVEIVGKRYSEVFSYPGRNPEFDIYEQVFSSGEPFKGEIFLPALNKYFDMSVCRSNHGRLVLTFWDITDRMKTEAALKISEERFRTLIEESPIAVCVSRKGTELFTNKSFKIMFGIPINEDTTGQPVANHYAEECFDDILKRVRRRAVNLPVPNKFDAIGLRRDGSKFYTHLAVSEIKLSDGRAVVSFIMDITERKKAREALARAKENLETKVKERTAELAASEEKYRTLVENANEVVVVAQDGKLKLWNKKTIEFSGYSEQELGNIRFLELLHPDDRGRVSAIFRGRIHSRPVPSTYEFRVINKNGIIKWAQINSAIVDWEGKPASLALISDITDRKKSEKELSQVHYQLKQYAKKITQVQEDERKRVAYELHDDTAQYLSILKMQIGALAESEEIQSPIVKEKLRFLERDADRAFNDVRRYSHELRPVVLEHQGLVAALEQIAEDFNKLGQLSVEVQIEGMEPELSEEVKLGFFRIAQEALNNIRKHSKASQANIGLRFYHKRMTMTVSDNGEGFDVKKALKTSAGKGSLGLMSMSERADLINANLKIESDFGKGTEIILTVTL